MKYTVRIKYQAESEIDVYASNVDEAEEEAANLLEFNIDGSIISLDVMDVTEADDPLNNDPYDDDIYDDDIYDDAYDLYEEDDDDSDEDL